MTSQARRDWYGRPFVPLPGMGWALRWAGPRTCRREGVRCGDGVSCQPIGLAGAGPAGRRWGHVVLVFAAGATSCASEDVAFDKGDDKDAVLIARLTAAAALLHPGAGRRDVGSLGASNDRYAR